MSHSPTFLRNPVKKILLAGLFLIATYFSANIIFEISSFVSLGHLLRKALFPAGFFWGILFIFYLYQQGNVPISFRFDKTDFSYKTILLILPMAFLFSFVILKFSVLGAIYLVIGLIFIIGVLAAFIFTMQRGDSKGLVILLLVYPLVLFVQHWFRWKLSQDPYEVHSLNIFMPYEIIWLLMFLAIFAYKAINKERFKMLSIQKLFLLFGFFLFISAVCSPIPLTSFKYLYRDCILPLVFLFIFIERVKTINDFKWLLKGIIFSGMILVFIGLYFFWRTGAFFTQPTDLFRSDIATTITGYLNLISILALILLPLIVSVYLYEKKMPIRIVYLIFLAICGGIILLSKNRSVQVALILTFPFLLLYAKAKLRYVFVPIVSIIAIAGLLRIPFVWDMVTARYQKWFAGGSFISNVLSADSVSIDLWRSAIRISLDHPLFGIGAGMWEDVYPAYASMPREVIQFSGNKPHSLFLQYFAFAGIGAGLSLIYIYLYTIIRGVKRIISLKEKNLYVLVVGLFWSVCMLFLEETIRGYQVFNYFGFTVMSMSLFFGVDYLIEKTQLR